MRLEDQILKKLAAEGGAVTIFLLNGVKLQGQITHSDEQTLLLRRERMTQLVYKHAISTIMPLNPIDL